MCPAQTAIGAPAGRICLLSFPGINDVPQACVKSSQLAPALQFHTSFYWGEEMDTATKISVESAATANDVLANAMAIICGLGLVMLACMATNGLDLSVGFF
jgi:hypothetical protein